MRSQLLKKHGERLRQWGVWEITKGAVSLFCFLFHAGSSLFPCAHQLGPTTSRRTQDRPRKVSLHRDPPTSDSFIAITQVLHMMLQTARSLRPQSSHSSIWAPLWPAGATCDFQSTPALHPEQPRGGWLAFYTSVRLGNRSWRKVLLCMQPVAL